MNDRPPIVDVRGLHVRFGEVEAVAGVDLVAYAGQSSALLGRNGAGKSTTMRVLAGVVPATAGTVVVDYRPIAILNRFGPYSADSVNAFLVVQQEAGDEVAKEFHDLLFADQPAEEGPFPDTDWLVEKAVEAGADEAAVRPGIEDGSRMDDVEAATQEAEDAGVQGTPTVVLDGVAFRDGKSWEEIADNLVEEVS